MYTSFKQKAFSTVYNKWTSASKRYLALLAACSCIYKQLTCIHELTAELGSSGHKVDTAELFCSIKYVTTSCDKSGDC